MEILILLILMALGGWWLYTSGKRLGSRKGFGAGRFRKRRRR